MKAEKIQLVEYQCPSCGADLHYKEDQFMITCKYCGARVERELDRTEHDKVSARKQLGIVKKYYENMLTLKKLEKNRRLAMERVKLCSQNSLAELTLIEKCPFIVFFAAILLSCGLFLAATGSVAVRVLCVLILMASVPVFIVEFKKGKDKQRLIEEARARLDQAQQDFVKAGDELEAFDKSFDKDLILERYRDLKTLEYLIHVFETYQAATMGEGLKLCDEYLAHLHMEEMKKEQLARVMMLSDAMRQERAAANAAVGSEFVPYMRRGSFAELLMAKRKAADPDADRDAGADLMMAIAKAAAKPDDRYKTGANK